MSKLSKFLREFRDKRRQKAQRMAAEKMLTRPYDEIFQSIYVSRHWGEDQSVSGPGSRLEDTQNLRDWLPRGLKEMGIGSLLDLPCGDHYWMSRVDLGTTRYIGADIVPQLIDENVKHYAATGRNFQVLDLCKSSLPTVDAILCRDCLVHLSDDLVRAALANVVGSGAKWLLTTCFVARKENPPIKTGQWRRLNLMAAPFNFPAPVTLIHEASRETDQADKHMAVWRVADIPTRFGLAGEQSLP